MTRQLLLVHTVPPLLEVFSRLTAELLPGVKILHILDEPLLERVRRRRGLASEDTARLATHVAEAAEVGADVVLVTCSTMSPCVDDLVGKTPIPVIKIDEAMIAEAVRLGSRIGVIATNWTTLEPTRALLETEARRTSKTIASELILVEGSLPALLAGDGTTHDRLVREAIVSLAQDCDVVLLAQASMARVLDVIPDDERRVPILSSPHLALAQISALLEKQTDRSNP